MTPIKNYMYSYLGPILLFVVMAIPFLGCEDVIELDVEETPEQLVVDAWINNLETPQIITLNYSQNYFDQSSPVPVTDASVSVSIIDGPSYEFKHEGNGQYIWNPGTSQSLGKVGDIFRLQVDWNGKQYEASTSMMRVPQIDSIGLEFRENEFFVDDGIYAQFYARDFSGPGDTYWIKTYKNGAYLDKSQELNLAYDAGFDAGTGIDGLIFIPPIREFVNELDEDLIPKPYELGDEIRVEIHSLSEEAFNFMEIARDQINNGDNGIFALPLANTRTNISTTGTDNLGVLGFFNVAAVSVLTKVVD